MKVVDPLPAGSTFVSATGTNWTCNNVSGTVTCNFTGNLAVGAAPNITLIVTAPSLPGIVSNTATVSSPNDNTPGNNSATATTTSRGDTTTTITSDSPDPSVVGQAVPITFTVGEVIPSAANPTGNVTVNASTGESCVGTVATGTCSITFTTAGARTLTATYAGDTNFNGSSSTPATPHQVNQASTTTTITSNRMAPGTAWTQTLSTASGPSMAQCDATGVPDSHGRLIVFARAGCSSGADEVWVLNGADGLSGPASWSLVSNSLPVTRHGNATVYDPVSNKLIIFGGCTGGCGSTLSDVWVLSNANGQGGPAVWTQLSISGGGPAGRNGPAGAYDPVTDRLIIFGGQNGGGAVINNTFPDVWALNNATVTSGTHTWTQIGTNAAAGFPQGQYYSRIFFDSSTNRLTIIGGQRRDTGTASSAVNVLTNANTTGGTWINLISEGSAGAPAVNNWNGSYDASGRVILSAPGSPSLYYLNNANGLGGPASYTQVTPSGGAGSASAIGLGYDAGSGRVLGAFQGSGLNRSFYLSPGASSSVYGESVTFTANVTVNAPGAGTPTGSVQFYDGVTPIGAAQPIWGGVASVNTSALTVGAHNITAGYSGDANFTSSTSALLVHTVTQTASTTSLVSSQNPSNAGQPVTFTSATLSGGNPVTEGSVTFKDGGTCASGGTVLGTVAVDGGGQAAVTTSALTAGSHTMLACYAGTNFAASQASVSQTVNAAPTCADDSGSTNEDTTLIDSVVCTDPENQALTYSKVTDPTNGTLTFNANGSFNYQPNANFNGGDSFTYKANDSLADSNVATYTITVNAVNDAPSFVKGADQTVNEDAGPQTVNPWATAISAGPANESGQTVSFNVTGNTNAGLFLTAPAVSSAGVLTYTPAANASGSATITLVIMDSGGTANGGVDTSASQSFVITVRPVNDAPVANDGTASTNEDTAVAVDLAALVSDVETSDANLAYTIVGVPAHGTLGAPGTSVTYTPNANFNGTDSFTYKVTDRGDPDNCGAVTPSCSGILESAVKTITITVNAVNDAPSADAQSVTTDEDVSKAITLTGIDGDPEMQTLTFTIGVGPAHGTLTGFNAATGAVTYVPALNYFGPDSFTFTVTDDATAGGAALTSAPATVSITVNPVNDAPVAVDDAAVTNEDTPVNFRQADLKGNDTDVDNTNAQLSVTAVSNATNGTVVLNGDGTVTFTPALNFFGIAGFDYTLSDGSLSDTGHVMATVNAVNDAPVCGNDSGSTNEDTPLPDSVVCTDIDSGSLSYIKASDPTHGSLAFNADGTFTYTPNLNYNGTDSFTFKANDGVLDSNEATYNITIIAVNDAPVGAADDYTTSQGNLLTVAAPGVLVNDTDVDSAGLTAVLDTPASNGTLALMADGSFTYDPNPAFVGDDTFTYQVTDGTANSTSVTVTIHVVAPVCTMRPAGMIAWYPGNNNTRDVIAGNDGTAAGTATFDAGKVARAFAFDGSDDSVVTAPNFAELQVTTGITIDAWINPASMTQDQGAGVVAKGSFRTGAYAIDIIENGAPSNPRTLRFFFYDGGADTSYQVLKIGWLTADKVNKWHHIAATYDSATGDLLLYDNGVQIAAAAGVDKPAPNTPIGVNGHELSIGSRQGISPGNGTGTYNLSFNGGIDEVEIFNHALTGMEIKSIFDASFKGKCNAAPAAVGDDYSTNEDAALTVAAPGVLGNDTDADGDELTAIVVAGPASGSLTLNPNGSFSYTPNANFNGADSFTYKAYDGIDESSIATVNITVNSVNDVPSFTKGANQIVNEDAPAQSVSGWATAISAGPANESGQSVDFVVTNDNNSLFAVQPAIAANGTLTYTPAANANGPAVVTVQIHDNGGITNGGVDTSAAQTFTITVNAVNDAPSFTKGPDQTVNEDAGPQTVDPWATAVSAGPANESGQTVSFNVTSNTNSSLFLTAPAVSPAGVLTYTPAANASGTATVTLVITDNGGVTRGGVDTSAPQSFVITVNPVNDAPTAADGSATTFEDNSVSIGLAVLVGDLETADADLAYSIVDGPDHGSLDSPGTSITYTPAPNFNGTDTFTYKVTDRGDPDNCSPVGPSCSGPLDSAVKTITIAVDPVNDAPSFVSGGNDTVLEDSGARSVPNWATAISAGPADESGQPVAFNVGNNNTALFSVQPSISPSGTLAYTPAGNANGSATVTVTLSDNGGTANGGVDTSAAQTFTITVTPVNDAPAGADTTVITAEDTAHVFGLLAFGFSDNDDDAPANNFAAVRVTTTPGAGALTLSSNPVVPGVFITVADIAAGNFRFVPGSQASGSPYASFTFQVQDDGGTVNGGVDLDQSANTITINVTPVNDAPVAADGTATTNEDVAVTVDLGAFVTDVETTPGNLTYSIISGPTHGTLGMPGKMVTYTPAANYNGGDSFTYQVTDRGDPDACTPGPTCSAALSSQIKTVSITVDPVNDPPNADAQSVTTDEDVSKAITLTGSDGDGVGQTLTFAIATGPTHGTLSGFDSSTGAVTYNPAPDYNGSDSFTFTVTDDTTAGEAALTSAPATVSITINAVNDAPIAQGDSHSVNEDTLLTVNAPGVLGNDTDLDSAGLSAVLVTGPAHVVSGGSFTLNPDGSFSYQSDTNYNGTDSFTYKANDDDLDSNVVTVNITIAAVNDAPVANDDTASTDEDVAVDVAVRSNDTDIENDTLTVNAFSQGSNGSVSLNGDGTLKYTPNPNYFGSDSFTYSVSDGQANSNTATVSVTIRPVNDAPVGVADTYSTNEDVPLHVAAPGVKGNDTDVENNSLTVILNAGPAHADSFMLNADGSFDYTPALNYNGLDSFTYHVCDNGQSGSPLANDFKCSGSVTVSINVIPVNDTPANVSASATPSTIDEDQSTTVSGSFTDPDATDAHTVTIPWGDGTPNASFSLAPGVFVYSVNHQYKDDNPPNTPSDVYTVSVTVSDGSLSSSASTSVTVNNVAPIVTSISGPVEPKPINTAVAVTTMFTDVGTQDTHTCLVNWDDGAGLTANGTVTQSSGAGTCSASKTFTTPGVHTVTVRVTDDDLGYDQKVYSSLIVIFDPNGGFVTGGGWIMSPAGACQLNTACLTQTGRANFGFVSKYKRGSNVPEGQTEFQFQAGNLNFHSSAYDVGSLVVQTYKAQYKGVGEINGQSGYKFVLTAYDGDINGGGNDGYDKFRIKITTMTGTVVYDNRVGASDDIDNADPLEISGGSINIQKAK